jgi:hypothetical protein
MSPKPSDFESISSSSLVAIAPDKLPSSASPIRALTPVQRARSPVFTAPGARAAFIRSRGAGPEEIVAGPEGAVTAIRVASIDVSVTVLTGHEIELGLVNADSSTRRTLEETYTRSVGTDDSGGRDEGCKSRKSSKELGDLHDSDLGFSLVDIDESGAL